MSQLRAGAVLSYLSIIISMIIALVYTPIMIRLLGQSEFGLYSLIGSLAAYFSVMDMGLGNAMVRFTARNRIIGSESEKAKLNGMFLTLYTLIGFITVIVGSIVYKNIETVFSSSLTIDELAKAKLMIIVLIINFALSFPLSVFNSLIRAHEKFVVEGLISITRIIMSPIIILPTLYIGYGAVSMVIITTVVNLLCLSYALYYSFSKLKIKVYFGKIEISLLKEVIGYSFFVFLNVIVDQFFWKTDQVILGIVTGTSIVAVYAIAMQFITLYMKFSTGIANLFLPKVSMMEAKQASNDEFTNEMIKFGRVQFIIISLILSGFLIFGYDFISMWAGKEYRDAYLITLIIMIPLTIPLIQNIGISILQAKDLHGFRSVVYLVIAIIKVIITIPLAKVYGGMGAAIATAVSLILAHFLIMNIYYHKRVGINIILFWKNILKLSVPIVLTIAFGIVIVKIVPYDTILVMIIQVIIFTCTYLILLWSMAMNEYEKNIMISFINKGLKIIKRNE